MKTQAALIEIFCEELPPKTLPLLMDSFAVAVKQGLEKQHLNFSTIQSFATPRRLALIINDLAEKQPDNTIEKRGPAIKVAFDDNDQPSKAAQGFARSCGIDMVALERLKTEKGEWLVFRQKVRGKSITVLLPEIVKQALTALPIPKPMRWGDGHHSFVRPVHAIILRYGKKTIPATILGIHSADITYGHRFHAPAAIKISHPKQYQAKLEKAKVMVDFSKRKEKIAQQLTVLTQSVKGQAVMAHGLLEEVTALVEWPQVLVGNIDPEFLSLPREVLISVLQQHQKCFAVEDNTGKLLPYFIAIANICSKEPQQVITGNERVVRARLSDAAFFYQQDRKQSLADRIDQLKQVAFVAKLGSLHDKAKRVVALSKLLAKQINADQTLTERAAWLAKTDLLTEVVGEFPELQGTMGRYYATADGESDAVAIALMEQYLPRFADDELPITASGQVLAIADRVDSLVGIFGIGKIPTGTTDPYGLRRATLGILRLIIDKRLDIDLLALLKQAQSLYECKLNKHSVTADVWQFIAERHKQLCLRQGVNAETFAAVAACNPKRLVDFDYRLKAVSHFQKLPQAVSLISANKRVKNILAKNDTDLSDQTVDPTQFVEPEEKALFDAMMAKETWLKQQQSSQVNYTQQLTTLAELQAVTNNFFDRVMVMADNKALRQNRLLLLEKLRQLFLQVADVSLLRESP